VLVQFICRFLVATVLVQMLPGLHGHGVSNLTDVRVMHGVDLALLVVAAVVLAPPAEELLFRGVLLRVLTVRTGFWAAAFISSVLFGVAHAHEEHAVLTGVVLAVLTGLFGVLQCVLVRRTGRLFPAILTHSMMNGAAISLVFALH
jgi:membrane protease YdiL (CAAX protease family)